MAKSLKNGKMINGIHHKNAGVFEAAARKAINEGGASFCDVSLVMEKTYLLLSAALFKANIRKNKDSIDVTRYFLSKSLRLIESIRLLLKAGINTEAAALSRILAENGAMLKYILSEKTEERLKRFREYEYIEKSKNANHRKEAKLGPISTPAMQKIVEQKKNELKHLYGPSYFKHWSGEGSVIGVFKKIGKIKYYISTYWTSSKSIHPSYLGSHQYKAHPRSKFITWEPLFQHADEIGLISLLETVGIASDYIQHHDIADLDALLLEIGANLQYRLKQAGVEVPISALDKIPNIQKGKWTILYTESQD